MLNKNELAEFKWTVKEYIKYGEENAIDQRWMKELENASAKHHIDKLTALKLECQAEYDKAFNTENQKVADAIKEAYIDRYDHVGYEVQKGFNVGFKLNGISEEKLDKVIRKPWAPDGKNFSDRIWTKKEQMVEELYQALVRNTLGGSNLKDVINSMTKYVDKSTKNAKSAAARLVMTESAYFASQGQKDCFNDLGVEKYEIVATLDNKTSDICQGLDGKVFEMKEFEPGTTAPPFHVNCRSTTAPYFDDEFSLGERAARGEDGKTYYVPSDMTYKEWKGKQDELKQETIQKAQNNNIIYEIDIDNKFGKSIKEIIDRLQSEYNNPNLKRVVKYHQSGNSKNEGGNCAPGGENISLRWKDPQIVVHEYFHSLIQKQFNTKNIDNEAFWKEIDKIYKDYRKAMSQRDFRDYIITDYANTNAEEFAAESFSVYKLNQWGMEMPYGTGENLIFANRVGNVVDKFFGKKILQNNDKNGKIKPMYSGAISGALDRNSKEAMKHAERYYESIRNRKDEDYLNIIAKRSKLDVEDIRVIKNYIFIDKHELSDGYRLFDADYEMAESWQRLSDENMELKPQDIIMLNHELLEKQLVDKGYTQEKAHNEANKKFNYEEFFEK